MTRVDLLRSQAEVLRRLAESFDIPDLRRDVLALAVRCEELAAQVLHEEAQGEGATAAQEAMASIGETTSA